MGGRKSSDDGGDGVDVDDGDDDDNDDGNRIVTKPQREAYQSCVTLWRNFFRRTVDFRMLSPLQSARP